MIRFRFELYPLEEVAPWGGDRPNLHWFGLTDGWFWLEAGGHELLRLTRVEPPSPPYIDYYVVRLWEDVNALTHEVLEPVPADLRAFMAGDPAQWVLDPSDFMAGGDEAGPEVDGLDAADHPVVTAAIWHGHHLNFSYLRNSPDLRFWRTVDGDRDEITVDWRHEDDGDIGYTAGPALRFSVPTSDFLVAVHTLDRELIAAMDQRIGELERRGGLPDVELDLDGLRHEHEDRRHWLARTLTRPPPDTDWDAVRQGARLLLG